MKSRHTALLIGLLYLFFSTPDQSAAATREMENLDRGVVAICNTYPSVSVYVGWRMLGTEPQSVSYNVYRNGTKLNSAPITGSCNYLDTGGSVSSTYQVSAIIDGQEQEQSDPVSTWTSAYLGSGQFMGCQQIPLKPRTGYEANDASVGDIDGDGEYELILKRLSTTRTVDATQFHYLEAYEMDGTLIWEINLGPNLLFAPLEINPCVYDFDGDGKAEIVLRTCDGVIDAEGNIIGSSTADYRSSANLLTWYWMTQGPEFLSVFDGETGVEIARTDYIERDPISDWGDNYGHRANKCMLTPAYLNGQTPSIVISRGIYEKTVLEAWNFRNGSLTHEWTFSSDDNPTYAGQGNHNLTVGDCDGDGFDEIVYGQMTVDHDGTGLYSTRRGHGDAIHMSEMIPGQGLQIYGVHEHAPYGADLRDAATGVAIWEHTAGGDTGRGCAAHIDADNPGYQMWDVASGGTYDCATQTKISDNTVNWGNFLIWWDGDLQREILDGVGGNPAPVINKWDSVNNAGYRLISLYNYPSSYATKTINSSKANPCLSGDLIGDWREEAIFPAADHASLYIYTTTTLTAHRIYTLMHDSMYRQAIAWQCNQYNQPPHPSFYIGAGMNTPPTPDIILVTGDTEAPEAPAGLTAAAEDFGISLDWSDNAEPDLAGYTVYRSATGGSGYVNIASEVANSAYFDSDVASTTIYYYVVTATDTAMNESVFSAETNSATGTVLIPPVPPVGYYRFEEGTAGSAVPSGGSQVVDSAGGDDNLNAYDAAAAPEFSANVPVVTLPQTGATNILSSYFDGNDDLYTALVGPFVTTEFSDFTVEAYVNFSSLSGFQTIVGRDDDWTNNGGVDGHAQALFYLSKANDDHFRVEVSTVDGDLLAVESTVYASAGTWYHLAAVGEVSTGMLTLYIDGQSAGTILGFDGLYPTATHAWTVGRGQYNGGTVDQLTGYIDEVRFTASALSTNQFLNAFNSDLDNDGLEDVWELAHFGNLAQTGSDDPDGDGDDNEAEETNNEFPTISSIPPNIGISFNSDSMGLGWSSNHKGWVLEFRTNLQVGADWLPIPGSDITNGYEAAVDQSGMFYRLVYP